MQLDDVLESPQFQRYLDSEGVKRYRFFAEVYDDWKPTVADAAMYLYESRGKAY